MTSSAYQTILELVDSGKLTLVSVIAPPRSCSTILERALSNSPSIDGQINDPWAIYDTEDRESLTYQYILGRIENMQIPSNGSLTVLVKNVADYILPGSMYLRWLDACEQSIILSRSPEVMFVSLVRKVLDECDIQPDGDDYTLYENDILKYFRESESIMNSTIYTKAIAEICADVYESSCSTHDIEDNLSTRISGWRALWEHEVVATRHRPNHIRHHVDATLMRLTPESTIRALSSRLGIDYSELMTNWPIDTPFETDYEGEVPYYDRVTNSSTIEPPLEDAEGQSVVLPEFISRFIHDEPYGARSIYSHLFTKSALLYEGHDTTNLRKSVNSFLNEHYLDKSFVYNFKQHFEGGSHDN